MVGLVLVSRFVSVSRFVLVKQVGNGRLDDYLCMCFSRSKYSCLDDNYGCVVIYAKM